MLKKHLGVHASIRADAVQTMAAAAAPHAAYSTTSCSCETPARVDGGDCAKRIELGIRRIWVDEDIVDLTDIELPIATGDLAMPTVSVDEHLKSPWSYE